MSTPKNDEACERPEPEHPTDEETIERAREQYNDEGTIEIDHPGPTSPTIMVSRGDGNEAKGAYVQAWVWVADPEVKP